MCNVEPKKKEKETKTHLPPQTTNLKRCKQWPLMTVKFRTVTRTFCATESRNFVQWETKDVRNKQNLYCLQQ